MGSNVDEPTIEAFERDGAVCLRGVFEQRWLRTVTSGIERNLAEPGPYSESLQAEGAEGGPGKFFDDYCNWQEIREYRDYVFESPAAEIAARLMRSRQAIFYHEHVFIKDPHTEKRTPWHHDQPYYPVDGSQICSIWMPLDPIPLETSLRLVKGSHAWGRWFMPQKFETERDYPLKTSASEESANLARYEPMPDIDGHPERYEILAWAVQPGDCVVFHGRSLHGAFGNTSQTTSRRVLSTRWLGDDARLAERPWEVSPPITGGLKPGEPMACETFPVIWPSG